SLNSRSIAKKIKAIVPILMPLFIASVRRAEDLATAMIMRGYSDGKKEVCQMVLKDSFYPLEISSCGRSFLLFY
ncbi:energy-coupling factor transporter transmembrane component T, partial [Oenococcus oeni]